MNYILLILGYGALLLSLYIAKDDYSLCRWKSVSLFVLCMLLFLTDLCLTTYKVQLFIGD